VLRVQLSIVERHNYFRELVAVKINQSVFTSRVHGLICDSEARTAIGSDGQHIGTSETFQALNALRELLGIL
jgi:hypothetical protein